MQITKTTDELCAMARSGEKLNVATYWALSVALLGFAGCFLYNVFSIAQPWIRLGSAWTLGWICYLWGTHLQHGPRRSQTNEPCAHFLEREFEGKRRGFLALRRGLFLLIPGVAASCWGGGPTLRARSLGFAPSSWLFQISSGPWPFLIVGAVLILVWLAFGKAAEKALRDGQDVRRSIES